MFSEYLALLGLKGSGFLVDTSCMKLALFILGGSALIVCGFLLKGVRGALIALLLGGFLFLHGKDLLYLF